jgi:aerobic-type carbon monoxide dehydrogenase small subunit (CoxS/CutS family)
MKIEPIINGAVRAIEVEPGELLIDTLRRIGLHGVKLGCGEGDCGTCTILLDGEPMLSCLLLSARTVGHQITTIEGLGSVHKPHPVQQAYAEEGAVQCGYCIPGSILSSAALLRHNHNPSDAEICQALDGNLCRCTGYVKKIVAVKAAAKAIKEQDHEG